MKMTPYFCIMCFGLSVHALMDSNIASRLLVLIGPICMVYQGKLLVAMAIDANNKVFPLAFTIVDSESGSSWRWFLQFKTYYF